MILFGMDLHGLITNAENLIAIGGLPYMAIKFVRRYREIDQSLSSVNTRDRRANIAEKRRIYTSVLVVLDEVMIAATVYRVARLGGNGHERKAAMFRQTKAQESMSQIFWELMLIAPPVVAGNAIVVQNTLVEFIAASHVGAPFIGPEPQALVEMRNILLRTMRVDLGEPADIPEQMTPAQEIQRSRTVKRQAI